MQLNHFDFNLIRQLDALLDERNVTRAATRLFVTQQAMSGSLRRLRAHFDDPLLLRIGQHFELTDLGSALRQPVRELMLQIEATLGVQAEFRPLEARHHFRIAVSDYAAMIFMPVFMPLLATRAPHIVCDILPINKVVLRDLEQGNLDFCVLPGNLDLNHGEHLESLRSIQLFEDDFVCAVAADHTQVGDALTLDDYSGLTHCVAVFGNDVRSMVQIAWDTSGIAFRTGATASSFADLLFMLPGTSLVATAQRKLVSAFTAMLPIRSLECPLPIGTLKEELRWHSRNDSSPAHGFVRGLFEEASANMNHGPEL